MAGFKKSCLWEFLGRECKTQTTLVEAQVAGPSDRGSTPLTSTNIKRST